MSTHQAANIWDAEDYDDRFSFVTEYGDELLTTLAPEVGQRILDLGCGTGHHAAALAATGATAIGLDSDPRMIAAARNHHPDVAFVCADAAELDLGLVGGQSFDAVLSNAALHWMPEQGAVLRSVRSVMVAGGRFVAEMGGVGNISALDSALRAALTELDLGSIPVPENYFPSADEQGSLLADSGFRVESLHWYRRPTALGEGLSAADWTRHFRAMVWREVPEHHRAELAEAIDRQAALRGSQDPQGRWWADYCRLRFLARAT